MKTYIEALPIDKEVIDLIKAILPYDIGKVCFFDIETTGLSPNVSNVYLIGAAVIDNDAIQLMQYFADDYTSEPELLRHFSDLLTSHPVIIHFNGTTFDVPYLEKKYAKHGLPSPFISCDSLDIYKRIQKNKRLFPTKDHKLITMEKQIGFDRGRDFSGKECISLYSDYMQSKYSHREDAMSSDLQAILSHNRNDLIGTILTAQYLMYTDPVIYSPKLQLSETAMTISDTLPDGMSFPFDLATDITESKSEFADIASDPERPESDPDAYGAGPHIYVIRHDQTIKLILPLCNTTMYHFFEDYKNYYYLPDEDMAIHKSVGSYVDREHRQNATYATCYVKKSSAFIPLRRKISSNINSSIHYFYNKDEYAAKKAKALPYLDIDEFQPDLVPEILRNYLI